MPATAIYASILGLMLVVLSVRTIRLRQRLRIAIGDGGNKEVLRAMRVHANFSEYVPLALRVTGMILTFVALVGTSLRLLLAATGVA